MPRTDSETRSPVMRSVDRPSEAAPTWLRWAPVAGFGMLLLVLSRHASEGVSDPDTLWHILAGDHLRRTWEFAGPDPLSTFTVHPWVLTQWLPELAMSLANQWGGLPAVVFLVQVARLGVCVAVYVSCRRSAGPLAAALVTGVAVLGTASSLSPRPQLAGLVFLAVTASAWLATIDDRRPRWWLVPIAWLWASSHGTWVVGVMVGLAVVVGLVLDRAVTVRGAVRLALVPLACAVAALVTPLGPRILETFGTVRAVSPYIQEWRRPQLSDPSTLAFLLLAVVVVLAWVRWRPLASWANVGIFVLGLAWGLTYSRSVALGAVLVAPLAARALDHALGRARPRWGREPRVLAALVALAVMASGTAAAAGPHGPVGVPNGLTPALRALPADSVVWNDDSLGGWLMWSFPELRQTADTRAELYGAARARGYLRAVAAEPGWQSVLGADHPDAALLRVDVPLSTALQRDRRWTVVARDEGFVLLVPNATG